VVLPVAALAVIVAGAVVFAPRPAPLPDARPAPAVTYAPPAAPPVEAAVAASDSIADLVDPAWLASTSARTGIPERALAAYAGAAVWKSRQMPTCGVSWNTLAAIGYVESKHGSYGGATIRASGKVVPKIFGVALDGNATAHIPDSDDGRFDDDAKSDRAIGPMQMIPESWGNWRTDANDDGKRDPHNMFDAVMAAANYLCRASPDMVGVDGWKAGIAAYNSAPSYLVKVAEAGVEYAR
jgi:membrane-bound lytic murein transglycosylase B